MKYRVKTLVIARITVKARIMAKIRTGFGSKTELGLKRNSETGRSDQRAERMGGRTQRDEGTET